jgi:hypothetical protein
MYGKIFKELGICGRIWKLLGEYGRILKVKNECIENNSQT